MPLIDADFRQLEWLCATYLSKDEVAYSEINKDFDIHSDNQARLGLPERLVAKTFLFRLIYGGSAYAYANDPEFTHISTSDKYWQALIDKFYDKYRGLHSWHSSLVREVNRTGKLVLPTGRVYTYERTKKGEWPRTKILNYPVQGLGADLMAIACVSLHSRLQSKKLDTKLISTVHDSIILDSPSKEVEEVCSIIKAVWADIPRNFSGFFGSDFDLPCRVEIKTGPDWGNMVKIQ